MIRTQLLDLGSAWAATRWIRRQGLACVVDDQGFVVIARNAFRARRTMAIDRSEGNHTRALGLALGYPRCCCREAARRGDGQLDQWAAAYSHTGLSGLSRMLDPARYAEGKSMLSHIPCGPRCTRSLQMARLVVQARHQLRTSKLKKGKVLDARVRCHPLSQ